MNFYQYGLGIPWIQVMVNVGILISIVAQAVGAVAWLIKNIGK